MLTSLLPRILLVEDDSDVFTVIAAVLEAHHIQVDRAETDLSAIGQVISETYAAIIVDVKLIRGIGLKVLKHLHDQLPHLLPRLIVVTGDDSEKVRAELQAIGICDVIPKPVEPQIILKVVQHCLDISSPTVN